MGKGAIEVFCEPVTSEKSDREARYEAYGRPCSADKLLQRHCELDDADGLLLDDGTWIREESEWSSWWVEWTREAKRSCKRPV